MIADLYGSVDVIIDGGETPLGLESTIVDLSRDYPVLLRPGPATIEEIKKIVPNLYIPDFLLKKRMNQLNLLHLAWPTGIMHRINLLSL